MTLLPHRRHVSDARTRMPGHSHRTRFSALLAAVLVTATVATANPTPTAQADVFHGYWIKGRIEETFHRLGGYARFGDATTPESNAARGGKFQVFAKASSIYWHPNVSGGVARQVEGRIRDKWRDLGWENSRLKYPTTDQTITPDGKGRFNHFEGGSIYWSPATDAHQIEGLIFNKWAELGYEVGDLGYPTTDEATPPDGVGRFNHFENGSIYFHPAHGTHQITGKIREFWKNAGWETGKFGYPTSDPYNVDGGIRQDFVGGSIQTVEPTGVALPKYDNAAYSSYRQIRPLFTTTDHPQLTNVGLNREVITNMGDYFPLTGCPDALTTGAVCTFTSVGGATGTAVVDRIGDTGFTLKTQPGHPEGAGRLLTVRFDQVTAPPSATDSNAAVVFDTAAVESAYTNSDKTWIRLVIEATGPTSGTQVAGPFTSDHVAAQVFGKLSTSVRTQAPKASTTYIAG